MKRFSLILLFLLLVTLLFPVSVLSAGPDLLPNGGMEIINLLDDSGFESDNYSEWSGTTANNTNYGSDRVIIADETVIIKNTIHSVKVTANDVGVVGSCRAYNQINGLSPSTTYTIGAWLRADSGNDQNSVKIGMREFGGGSNKSTAVPQDDNWYWRTATVTTGAAITQIYIDLWVDDAWPSGDTDDIGYFDGIILVQASTLVPQSWTLSGAGAVSHYDWFDKVGTYSAALDRNGNNAFLYQYASWLPSHQGEPFTFGAWINSGTANSAVLYMHDGVGGSYSDYHSGGGDWEWITLTYTLDAAATQLGCELQVRNSNGTSYFDSAILVHGISIPINWIPSTPNVQRPNVLTENPEHVLSGTYSLVLDGNNIYTSGTVPFTATLADEPYIATAWVYSATASAARIAIHDGIGTYYSPYHTGVVGWEELEIQHMVSPFATELGIWLCVATPAGAYYFDDAELRDDTACCPTLLIADDNANTIDLEWEPCADATYIWANADAYPTGPGDGDLVYSGTGSTALHEDLSLINDFYYRAWGHNWAGYSDCYDDAMGGGISPLWVDEETPTWWEENIMLITLAIILSAFTIGGYALHKGDLTITGGLCFVLLGAYAYIQSDSGISPLGTAAILIGIIIMLAGATMWRTKSEADIDDEIDLDGESEPLSFREKSKKRRSSMRERSIERRRYQRDMEE